MEYSIDRKETIAEVTLNITAEEWAKHNDEAFLKTKHKYSVPGFRKGHVPRKILENLYGKDFLSEDALELSFTKYYAEAVEELPVLDYPSLKDFKHNDDGSVTVIASVEIRPEIELGEYKGIEVVKADEKVSDEELQNEINRLMNGYARTIEVTDRAVENGDNVTIDYSGSVDGVKFDGGTAENQKLLIGSGSFIPGFEEQLIGMNIGDEKDIDVKFPDEYHEETLKGKQSVFAIKLHKIEKREVPELTDETAADISEFNTAEEYKNNVLERLTKEKAERCARQNENKLVEAIVANAKVPESEYLIQREIDYRIGDFERMLSAQGIKLADYVKYTGQTVEKMREEYRESSARNVATQLVIAEIVKKENLAATPEQIEAEIAAEAAKQGKEVDEFKSSLPDGAMGYFVNNATTKTFVDFIMKENKLIEA